MLSVFLVLNHSINLFTLPSKTTSNLKLFKVISVEVLCILMLTWLRRVFESGEMGIVFPLISTPGAYLISKR